LNKKQIISEAFFSSSPNYKYEGVNHNYERKILWIPLQYLLHFIGKKLCHFKDTGSGKPPFQFLNEGATWRKC
jgi:hypothetical protein